MILLFILLIAIAVLVFGVFFYPKINVQFRAKRDGINSDVWNEGERLKQRCQTLKTYYPFQFPTFAVASLAMAYETFLSTRSRTGEETVIAQFIAPVDYEALFNVRHKSHIDENSEEVDKEARNFDNTAFLLTTKNRLIFARWAPFTASTGSYSIDPNHFTVQAPSHGTYTEFYISPNANNEQEVLGRCKMPFGSVAKNINRIMLSESNKLSEKSLTVDEDGRRIL